MAKLTIEQSMYETVKSEKISGLTADTLDLGMKAILESNLAKDIPIFGLLVKSYGALTHITESILAKKIYKFLLNINDLPFEKRVSVIDGISAKKGGTREAGEVLIILLNKADDMQKPDLIAKLFVECAFHSITVDQFLRISNIIVNTYIDDLILLKNIRKDSAFDDKTKSNYASTGLMQISAAKPIHYPSEYTLKSLGEAVFDDGFKIEHNFTEEAELIANICFDVPKKAKTRSLLELFDI
ncbi:hypothetical protein [Aliivibrio logei]|uniref:hypothetical protein n=1 Tax=Aliivibrio logei TaxID=688 RepID=UPI0035C9097F